MRHFKGRKGHSYADMPAFVSQRAADRRSRRAAEAAALADLSKDAIDAKAAHERRRILDAWLLGSLDGDT